MKSTRLKIGFFGLLLAALIGIQYSWVMHLQKNKLQQFRTRMISAISATSQDASFHELADTAIANTFRRSFSNQGLGNVPFEYALAMHNKHFASAGYMKNGNKSSNLVLHYELRHTGEMVTIVVPFWKRIALKELAWIIVASVLLTAIIASIFYSATYFARRGRLSVYDNRTKLVKNMMQQLEAPLSAMSVATEALRNAKVMHDEVKINYYQKIITEENQRMNEQVEKFLREIK